MSRRSRWRDRPFPKQPPKRPPPEHGIKVKRIGTTWWGKRWIGALERLSRNYQNRLARGRNYARAGRVHDLEVAGGRVTARVTGSRASPYKVTLRVAALDGGAWNKAIGVMSRQVLFAAELLAGRMPEHIDNAFRAAGRSLFPATEKDLATECSCPDYANPCKHVAATHYVLGEALDQDPFLLFELRGRSRDDVLAALRRLRAGADGAGRPAGAGAARGGAGEAAGAAAPVGRRGETADAGATGAADGGVAAEEAISLAGRDPAEFELQRGATTGLHFRIEPPAAPAAVLRQLGAPPAWSLDSPPADILAPLYQAAGALARDLALRPEGSVGAGAARTAPARGRTGKRRG
jgi:uncharacterized Zn finger protein